MARPPVVKKNGPDPAAEAFQVVTSGYYRAPDPAVATRALEYALTLLPTLGDDELPRFANVLYLFGRIAQSSEEADSGFQPLVAAYKGRHHRAVAKLADARASSDFPNALEMPIDGPGQLDLLWAEFFATGADAPLELMVETLDWPDTVRARLQGWLGERSWFGQSKRRATAKSLSEAGLAVDVERRTIEDDGDLDCLCFSIAEGGVPIFKRLPFDLSADDVRIVGTKSAALWSLRLNAQTHEIVADVCAREAEVDGGAARRRLVEALPPQKPFSL